MNMNDRGKPNIGSWHPGAVNSLLCDGSIDTVSIDIDQVMLERLTMRNDGESVTMP